MLSRSLTASFLCTALLVAPVTAGAQARTFRQDAISYADTMLQYGTDRYGADHTPMFVVILSRDAQPHWVHEGNMAKASKKLPGWEHRYYDRSWGGANLGDHIQLHELLAKLTEATGDAKYIEASNADIACTFRTTQSAKTGLIAWGEHLSWNVGDDEIYHGQAPKGTPHADTHEPGDRVSAGMWDRAFDQLPDEAFRFAEGLWQHQIADHRTGAFSRHAAYTHHKPSPIAASFPRVGGWMILVWAKAYQHSSDAAYRATMLQAINTLAALYERSSRNPAGVLPAGGRNDSRKKDFSRVCWLTNPLYMACDLEQAIPLLPEAEANRLRSLQKIVDEGTVTRFDHNLDGHIADMPKGFLRIARPDLPLLPDGTMQPGTGRDKTFERARTYTCDWAYGYGSPLTSHAAMLILERYSANGDARMLALVRQAADRYLETDPPAKRTAAFAVSSAIDLMVGTYRATGEAKYLERANHFGRLAEQMFLKGDCPLPMATSGDNHYEALAGGDDLMLSLWNLARANGEGT